MGSIFRFKHFEVDQADCAMKINTDGVLLASISSHAAPYRILDIGTGTGVIALMLAQRYPKALVDAVEIDEKAAHTAGQNFQNSPFHQRLHAYCADITVFQPDKRYELIVSNPPYFVNDLKNPEVRKGVARHAHEDFFDALTRKVASLLSDTGQFWFILPVKQAEQLIVNAVLLRLFPTKIIHVFSDVSKPEFRQIVCLSFVNRVAEQENFYIYESNTVYSDAYKSLLKDFFLAF